ncbi:MAG: Rpn family recombination-promoting nuclease/putative transposase [Treponema sp.]|uniref:Rpn family recombination-promoting nuclease/putative transposase n=1 Tax=Treponema sp. TaxID=166 RepID=UPI00298EBAA6|nr:Rpn family recombination-promoting nuclease/putative transposase [Treponema sp.]MBR5934205.1 Rpn family recombination-promoting nuclease/putative transposase [Treponema sp.]
MTSEKSLTPEEKWEKATIANNFIFYKVMRNNPDICKELLEILLQIKIDHIDMKQEETIEIDYGKKGVRLDVYAVGGSKAFNLEMQSTDTGELPERARYYQGILDVDNLDSGEDYKDLKDSYIIFICIPDIFNKGLAKYTFENLCIENPKIKLNDRTYKYFFIAENYDKISDERQKAFLKLVTSNESTNAFAQRISHMVEEAKHNLRWKKQFMDFEREKSYSFREGAKQKAIETASNLLKMNLGTPEQIAQASDLPLEKVKELASKL